MGHSLNIYCILQYYRLRYTNLLTPDVFHLLKLVIIPVPYGTNIMSLLPYDATAIRGQEIQQSKYGRMCFTCYL